MRYAVSVVTPPAVEPVTADEVRLFAKIDGDELDDQIEGWIATAREAAELYTNRSFITRTLKVTIDGATGCAPWTPGYHQLPVDYFDQALPSDYPLPRGPVISVATVTTYDTLSAGSVFPDANYRLSGDRIVLNSGVSWPSGLRSLGGTEIVYTAGYGPAPSDVPRPIRTAVLMHAAALLESCGCEMGDSCLMLLRPYRVMP